MLESLPRYLYYAVTGVCGLVLTFFWLGALYSDDAAIRSLTHKLIFLTAGAVGWGLIWASWKLASEGHWLFGAATSVAALFVSGVLVLAGLLMFTNIHWQ